MKNEDKIKVEYPTIEEITDLCLEKYETLAKTGKPNDNEWTVLAGIVMADAASRNTPRVIALGTGTKCLGADKMCTTGFKLNDSHAEVLARRAFMRFCYEEMFALNAATPTKETKSIFTWNNSKACYELKSTISFHFFSTRLPCGDACIPNEIDLKKGNDTNEEEPAKKRIKCDKDLIYTGAKIIDILEGDDKMAQNPCALRLKPGKGIRTSSMSCSDKLARWNIMGIQGALLYALMLHPIYFNTINILSADAEISVLERAIFKRFKNPNKGREFADEDSLDLGNFKMQTPQIRVIQPSASRYFKGTQSTDKQKPSPLGLVWCDIEALKNQQYQVCVDGKRQGVPSKRQDNPNSSLNISKYHILQTFLSLVLNKTEINERLYLRPEEGLYCYKKCKEKSKDYEGVWQCAKNNLFGKWTNKLKIYEEFCVSNPNIVAEGKLTNKNKS